MANATIVTGKELQELVLKAEGGIYIGENFENYISKDKISLMDGEVELMCDECTNVSIPLFDDKSYINYAIAGEDEYTEWNGSKYFDYVINTYGTLIAFNVTEKPEHLTIEHLMSLMNTVDDECKYIRYDVESSDYCGIRMMIRNCKLSFDMESNDININTERGADMAVDIDKIKRISNITDECGHVCYSIEFDGTLMDMVIMPSSGHDFKFIGHLRDR